MGLARLFCEDTPYNKYHMLNSGKDHCYSIWRRNLRCSCALPSMFVPFYVYILAHYSQKYLVPHLQPPNSTAYEEDRDALNAQFDAAEALLKEIQSETAAVRTAVQEQKEHIEKTTRDMEAVVAEMREGETRTRDEMREIRDEVNTIREMLPKVTSLNCLILEETDCAHR